MRGAQVPYLHLFSRNQPGHPDAAFKHRLAAALFRAEIQDFPLNFCASGFGFSLLLLFSKGKKKRRKCTAWV